jgi:hypothetical protein
MYGLPGLVRVRIDDRRAGIQASQRVSVISAGSRGTCRWRAFGVAPLSAASMISASTEPILNRADNCRKESFDRATAG